MKKLAIFASGTGSNALKMIMHFEKHPSIEVALIISNNPQAGVLDIARTHQIKYLIIEKAVLNDQDFGITLKHQHSIDWIALAGFLWLIPKHLISAFPGKIVNIHPALLPKYGGKGMYGLKVHEAVSLAGDSVSGMTVHFVNEQYDEGAICFQANVTIPKGETPEKIAARVLKLEHRYYPLVMEALMTDSANPGEGN